MAVAVTSTIVPAGLRPDLTFDRSALMKEAVRLARREAAAYARQFPERPLGWAQAMSFGLKRAWAAARHIRSHELWRRQRCSERAALPPSQLEALRVQESLCGADYIDSTRAMLAQKRVILASSQDPAV
jgi:hypothetical protein